MITLLRLGAWLTDGVDICEIPPLAIKRGMRHRQRAQCFVYALMTHQPVLRRFRMPLIQLPPQIFDFCNDVGVVKPSYLSCR